MQLEVVTHSFCHNRKNQNIFVYPSGKLYIKGKKENKNHEMVQSDSAKTANNTVYW